MPETIARPDSDVLLVFLRLRAQARSLLALLYASRDGAVFGESDGQPTDLARGSQSWDIASLADGLVTEMEALCKGHQDLHLLLEEAIAQYKGVARLARLEAETSEQGGEEIYGLRGAMHGNGEAAWYNAFYGGEDGWNGFARWEEAVHD